jgi:transposase-like protein
MLGRKLTDKQRGWLEHVEACEVSGGSMKAYAEKHGLDLQQFYLWKGRLKKLGLIEGASRNLSIEPARINSSVSRGASIGLANGIKIEVPADFDPACMTELLRAVMRF